MKKLLAVKENTVLAKSDEDDIAEKHELKVQTELNQQYRELKRQARGVFRAVSGRCGIRSEETWQQIFERAKIDYDSGKFLMERLGADRQLDPPLVATLTQLRQDLLADIENPSTIDRMHVDSAIIAYRNLLGVQGWIGNLCLQIERQLFGQLSLDDVFGAAEADVVAAKVEELRLKLLPLLESCQRAMNRALDRLQSRKGDRARTNVSIAQAGQVNVGSAVQNIAAE